MMKKKVIGAAIVLYLIPTLFLVSNLIEPTLWDILMVIVLPMIVPALLLIAIYIIQELNKKSS